MTLLLDRCRNLLRDEHEDFFVARAQTLRWLVGLDPDHAPRAIAGFQRRAQPVDRSVSHQLDLAFGTQPLENLRRGEQRLTGAQDEGRHSAPRWFTVRRRIELIDEVGERDDVVVGIVFGDVKVRRLHQCADDLVNLAIELGQVRRLTRHLRNAKQRVLHCFAAVLLRDIAEVPRTAGRPAIGQDRHRCPHENPAVFERDRIARAHFLRMFVEIVDQLDEAFPMRDSLRRIGKEPFLVSALGSFLRNSEDLEKPAVERQHLSVAVDDEDSVEACLLLCFQNCDRCPQRWHPSFAWTAKPAREETLRPRQPRRFRRADIRHV